MATPSCIRDVSTTTANAKDHNVNDFIGDSLPWTVHFRTSL